MQPNNQPIGYPTLLPIKWHTEIKPADIGFKTVKVEPHLGDLKKIKADMPHPTGRIKVEYQLTKKGLQTLIVLPQGMSGSFRFKGTEKKLTEGENRFIL